MRRPCYTIQGPGSPLGSSATFRQKIKYKEKGVQKSSKIERMCEFCTELVTITDDHCRQKKLSKEDNSTESW
jgi:hypothetical protein